MRTPRHVPRPQRQRGAVALLFGLTLLVLLAAGGLVVDLGHLYVLKSELQNGADAAALAGAKSINMQASGITAAADRAIKFAGKNKFNFASDLVITNADIGFSDNPDGPWATVSEATASPYGKSFIRVSTGNRQVNTYLMGVAGIPNMTTGGVAVAGRFVVDITPIGVCAVDPLNRIGARPTTPASGTPQLEMLEYGYRRGMTYDILQMKNIAGSSDPMLINPVDSPPTACGASNSSANFTAPFLCQGNSAIANNASFVYANTGVSAGPVEKALNSRFNQFGSGSACLASSAPPDRNVRDYPFGDLSNGPARWMNPVQTQQSQTHNAGTGLALNVPVSATTVGVLWTYSRPLKVTGTPGNYTEGAAFDVSEWSELYYNGSPRNAVKPGSYPSGLSASPYAETSGPYFLAPTVNTGAKDRRLMNLVILDCTIPAGSGACQKVPLLGVGRFFLQRPASMSGGSKGLYVEFAGLIEPVPNSEIKLYR
ncbi:MAG TPA: pilus assembly protein TadG-related protein [Telluria sp.]|nr:pilus assembly protein TadG-related protein [Telluria sp.]